MSSGDSICDKCKNWAANCRCTSAVNPHLGQTIQIPNPVLTFYSGPTPSSWECHRCHKINSPFSNQCTCQPL